jgi:hypothetical protein
MVGWSCYEFGMIKGFGQPWIHVDIVSETTGQGDLGNDEGRTVFAL